MFVSKWYSPVYGRRRFFEPPDKRIQFLFCHRSARIGNPHRKGGCRLPIPQQVMDASGLALEEHANASDGSYRLDHKDLWASPRYNLFRIDGSRTHNI